MNQRPIFIMGIERSGTTLMQRLINSSPGAKIHGEHGGLLCQSAILYHNAKQLGAEFGAGVSYRKSSDMFADPGAWPAKTSAYQMYVVEEATRQMVIAFGNPHRLAGLRWGFKEVRYGSAKYVQQMLLELYPMCQIIHTLRHPVDHIRSKMRKGWFSSVEEAVKWYVLKAKVYSTGANNHPQNCRLVFYEDMNQATLAQIFSWLELPWTPAQEAVLGLRVDCDTGPDRDDTLTADQVRYIEETMVNSEVDFYSLA